MQKYCAVAAGAALAFTLNGTALGGLVIDLSGITLGPTFLTMNFTASAPGMIVTGVDWDFTWTTLSSSWGEELSIELVAPNATANPVMATATGGFHPGNSPGGVFNPGTFVWGTPDGWSLGFTVGAGNSHNLGWPSSGGTFTSSGSTDALNGERRDGVWTLNLFDSYDDGAQGTFGPGSHITIHSIPAPGALALLGIAGLAGTTRRRRN